MATSFVPSDVTVLSTRTLIYTCPAATQSVVFAGTIANIDDTNLLDHWIKIEVQKVDTTYVTIVNKAPITYGGSLSVPKIVLIAGEKLYLTSDTSNVLGARVSAVEKV